MILAKIQTSTFFVNWSAALTSLLLVTLAYFLLTPYGLSFFMFSSVYYQTIIALLYFTFLVYTVFVLSILLYMLPNILTFVSVTFSCRSEVFYSLNLIDLIKFIFTLPLVILFYHSNWISPSEALWFGHLTFSTLQFKVFYLILLMLGMYLLALITPIHMSSLLVCDYLILIFHLWLWLWFIFFTNNLFSLIFFIELLSVIVMLLLITNVFTSVHFYNLNSYTTHTYFQYSHPTTFLQTLLTFFWVTLVSSILLFLFLIFFYLCVSTFDFTLIGCVSIFLVDTSEITSLASMSATWFLFILCVFIKGGVVPFYVWKPSFFKGISFLSLFFYIYVYYFLLFVYLVYCIFLELNELLTLYLYLLLALLSVSTIMVSGILFESFYIKAFLALSSILNSLILFFAITSLNTYTELFVL